LEFGKDFFKLTRLAPAAEPPVAAPSPWTYGYGEFDEATQRMKDFQPLPHFTGEAWQGGAQWPDAKLGWARLTAEGGHAGNDLRHAAVRRWTAPTDGIFSIGGQLKHEHEQGDGIVGRIICSSSGVAGSWVLQNNKADTKVESLEVRKGDTVDFAVDYRANLNSDDFKWSPRIKLVKSSTSATTIASTTEWSAMKDFAGPPEPPPRPLDPVEQYAQALLLSNEFLFID
jgi:hypothetical protein